MVTSLVNLVNLLFQIYSYMIIAYILMSWFPQMRGTQIGEVLGKLVEPYLQPFRKIIPPIGMMDFSPLIAYFALDFIRRGVIIVIAYLFGGF